MLLISETWLNDSKMQFYHLEGYNSVFFCRPTKKGGGLVMYIEESLDYSQLKFFQGPLQPFG